MKNHFTLCALFSIKLFSFLFFSKTKSCREIDKTKLHLHKKVLIWNGGVSLLLVYLEYHSEKKIIKLIFIPFISIFIPANSNTGESKKYVFCCTVCGGLVTILGSLFLTVYFLLRSLTSTLNYFETIPTFVPASLVSIIINFCENKLLKFTFQLIFTGILIMILSKRKYRNNYLVSSFSNWLWQEIWILVYWCWIFSCRLKLEVYVAWYVP